MRHRRKKHPYASEAANPETEPVRLTELAQEHELRPIIAANPNALSSLLESFAQDPNTVVRRATAQNPNTPLPQLLKLIEEFPHEFLCNPILPLLNLAQPDFIKKASPKAWLQLLRCEEIPQHWLQWLQQGHVMISSYVKEHVLLSYDAHISVAGEIANLQEMQKMRLDLLQPRSPLYSNNYIHELLILTCTALPDFVNHWLHQQELKNANVENLAIALRYSPSIDEDILRELSEHQVVQARQAVAHHPCTPEDVLLRLLQDSELEIRYSIAKRAKLSQSLLTLLASSSDPLLRKGVARQPQVEKHILEILAQDTDAIVRRAVAARHGLPERLYHQLAYDTDMTVRKAIAAKHGLSEQLYYQLAQDTYAPVRMVLARNVKTPPPMLLSLARDIEPVVRHAVAQNPRLPEEAFYHLAKDPNSDILAQLAGNARLPRGLFMRFAEHSDVDIRQKLAANPRISLEILDQLSHDPALWQSIARNPRATPDILTAMTTREKMRNSNQNPSSFQANSVHRPTVSKKKRTQNRFDYYAKELQSITGDFIRPELLAYEKLPIQFLYSFAHSPIPIERYKSAQHPNASMALLKELAQDANRYVRAAARHQLALRNEKKAD